MAAIHLTLANFRTGKYKIPDAAGNLNSVEVQEAIDSYEQKYIEKLLGVDQAAAYIAWVQAGFTPVNADYVKIRDAFSADDPIFKGHKHQSLGIVEFLKACVYFEYNKNGLVLSQAGVLNRDVETGRKVSPAEAMRFAENKFNDVLDTVDAIQWYCIQNKTAFPDFNGEQITVKGAGFI